jgi:hypothetical protein
MSYFLTVIPAQAGTHFSASAGGAEGFRFRGNDDIKYLD